MSNVSAWSTTAASNNASPPNGWPEGQAPSTVNDCAREMMSGLAKWYAALKGGLATTGSSNAYVLSTGSSHATLAAIGLVTFRANHSNNGASTLAVDALAEKSIYFNGVAVSDGRILGGNMYAVLYNPNADVYDLLNAGDSVTGDNVPTGTILDFGGISVPTNYLACDGSAVSRATYAGLFAALSASKGTFTVTIAAPGVFTNAGHGLQTGDQVSMTTTGALPTGLAASTNYYFIRNDANTGWLATTYANAFAGTKITTTGSQSGVHTLLYNPYGISGASDFLLPNFSRKAAIGAGGSATAAIGNRLGNTGGAEDHTLTDAEMPAHAHTMPWLPDQGGGATPGIVNDTRSIGDANSPALATTGSAGGGAAHNTMQPSVVVQKIIKT